MKKYQRDRQKDEKTSRVAGAVLAVGVHALVLLCCSLTGIKYLYPPPPEASFLLDFSEEEEIKIEQQFKGTQPQAEEIDLEKPIELVQKAESPYKNVTKTNETPATAPDDFGDVETPQPEQKKEVLDKRAAFPGMGKKDTTQTAPHSATDPKASFKAGLANGNTESGKATGSANAHLKGRNVVGTLPRPSGTFTKEGTVVITIRVDQYGTVTQASIGEGTTISDKTILAAARSAAMKAHFNVSPDAPALQEGTITYIYKY